MTPQVEQLPSGSLLWRIHRSTHGSVEDDGRLFNPGVGGPTRFGPLTPDRRPVPLLYAAATRRGALFESVLHDQMPGSVLDWHRWSQHRLTRLRTTRELRLVSLHGAYTHTDAAGLTWTSHQDDDERAFILFGDRVPPDALVVDGDSTPLGYGPGFDWALEVAASVRVEVIV